MSIIISHLNKKYKEKIIYKDFSYAFETGKIYGLLAPSGYGKTTLLNIISGLEREYKGVVEVKGEVSYVFQEPRLFFHMSVMENIVFVREDRDLEKLDFLLKLVDLYEQRNLYPNELSGGMKMRVSIARALYNKSDILLLDEAFAGIDNKLTKKILSYIETIKENKTILIVSHNEDLLKNMADVIVPLDKLEEI